jgi:hypothetical protein
MDSLKANKAIIDIEGKRLIYPGAGKIEWKFPPGTRVIPLVDSPSGHLCIPIYCYDGIVTPTVITPAKTLVATHAPSLQPSGHSVSGDSRCDVEAAVSPPTVGWMQAGTAAQLPIGLQHSRALVVEEHPIISNLFACQGYQVDTLHPAVVPGPQCAATCGEIRKQKYKAVWLTLPAKSRAGMRSKYCSTIVSWFRAAAAIGIATTLCAPRGERWIHEDIRMLIADGIGKETRHDLCAYGIPYPPESNLPSSSSYTHVANYTIDAKRCVCPPQTVHYSSDGTIRPYGICNRIEAEKVLYDKLFEDSYAVFPVSSLAVEVLPLEADIRSVSLLKGSPDSLLHDTSTSTDTTATQNYPTEAAVAANLRKKANKEKGIKPKKVSHVPSKSTFR